jgi:Na+-driven multidrug efflux pump
VTGAAISTLLSRIAAAAILTGILITNQRGSITLAGILKIKLVRPMIRNILNVGIPSGLESSMFQLGRLLTQRIFTVFGTVAMAANAISSVINSFSFMPGQAFAIALLTVVGQSIGAGDYEGAKRYTAKIMKIACLSIFLMSSTVFLFMDSLVSLFNLSGEAHELAKAFLRIHCVSMMFGWGASFALPNALRAAGDARYCMIVASVSMWAIRVIAAYLLAYPLGAGPVGVWYAMVADWCLRGVCYALRWKSGKWQEKVVIR